MQKYIPYGRQSISEADIAAVVDVLKSDWLTQGPGVTQFENAVADYCGARYAVAACNATAALHLACMALGVGAGDRIWTSANTFVASANCALYCGASVDFVDIDSQTYNMDVEALREKLIQAEKQGCLPKAVIPVHFSGQSCDMQAIKALAEQYGFYIIEDASHAIGGKYKEHKIGSCVYSDITVFSFHPVKIITTCEGGIALTNQPHLQQRLRMLVTHGITREVDLMQSKPEGPWVYQQLALGYNYRITDVQCVLGLTQLQRLDEFVESRHRIAARYNQEMAQLSLILPYQADYNYSAYHLYVIGLDLEAIGQTRSAVFNKLREAGIGVNVHYLPVYMHPYYQQLGFKPGLCPNAEKYYAGAISLPMFPDLQEADQMHVIRSIKEALA